jgi:plastocyanin
MMVGAVVGALTLVGAACGDDDDSSSDSDSDTTETTAADTATTTLDVTAEDFSFSGIPDEVEAGTVDVNFVNDGAEDHELIAFRFNDDATLDEILALSEEEAMERITVVGQVYAPAGESATGVLELEEPGRYGAICAIPVGTHDDTEGTGPPHFVEGMTAEFEVA